MFSLHFREQIAGIKQVLVAELDQIVASAQARWYAQHTDTGGHGVVTATSLTAPLVSSTRLVVGAGTHAAAPETVSGDEVIRVVKPDTPAFIVSIRPVDNTAIYLWSMSTIGRSPGELVLLRHEYEFGLTTCSMTIRSLSSSSSIPADAAVFFTPGSGGGTNYEAITFGAAQAVLCRLETAPPVEGRSAQTFWRTLGVLTT